MQVVQKAGETSCYMKLLLILLQSSFILSLRHHSSQRSVRSSSSSSFFRASFLLLIFHLFPILDIHFLQGAPGLAACIYSRIQQQQLHSSFMKQNCLNLPDLMHMRAIFFSLPSWIRPCCEGAQTEVAISGTTFSTPKHGSTSPS